MIVDLPSTDTSAVNRKMVELRESAGAVALGRVLTLVISTEDGPGAESAIQAANDASREHPCRVLVLARGARRAASRLDAQIRIGGDAGASEVIVLRMYGPLSDQGGSIIVPLLLPDAPIVAWWPGEPPPSPAEDPVGLVAGRRITDVATTRSPSKTLAKLVGHYRPGDTDLAWTRITSWRGLLTASLDEPPFEDVTRVEVAGEAESASADLLAGWLSSRLGVPVDRSTMDVPGGGIGCVRLERPSGAVELRRLDSKTTRLSQPGQPTRRVALPRRTVRECLAEELRRLDPDELFREALDAAPPGQPSLVLAREGQVMSAGARDVAGREVVVHDGDEAVAADGAARLLATLAAAQSARGLASVVLTGGGVGIAMLRAVAASPDRDTVDWTRVEVFWGDERFVPAGDGERNDAQAREALLDALPLDPGRVHPMASSTPGHAAQDAGDVELLGSADPDQAAEAYAQVLAAAAARLGEAAQVPGVPAFDVLLAGCGPEGHTLSVFPDSPAVHATAAGVVAVRDCPKPPPTRISLTLAASRAAREVWLAATGSGKAGALGRAATGASEIEIPLAGLAGTERTLWLLDQGAAAQL